MSIFNKLFSSKEIAKKPPQAEVQPLRDKKAEKQMQELGAIKNDPNTPQRIKDAIIGSIQKEVSIDNCEMINLDRIFYEQDYTAEEADVIKKIAEILDKPVPQCVVTIDAREEVARQTQQVAEERERSKMAEQEIIEEKQKKIREARGRHHDQVSIPRMLTESVNTFLEISDPKRSPLYSMEQRRQETDKLNTEIRKVFDPIRMTFAETEKLERDSAGDYLVFLLRGKDYMVIPRLSLTINWYYRSMEKMFDFVQTNKKILKETKESIKMDWEKSYRLIKIFKPAIVQLQEDGSLKIAEKGKLELQLIQ